MQYFIYHLDGERAIVTDAEYQSKLESGDWFADPVSAELERQKKNAPAVQAALAPKKISLKKV